MAQLTTEIQGKTSRSLTHAGNRVLPNTLASLANFTATVLLRLWFTPYVIAYLGVAGYGLVPLATAITSYLSIATLGINAAIGRYLTIAVESGDDEQADRIFNTSFFGSVGIAVLLLLPSAWFCLHVERFIHVPSGMEHDMRWLFTCTIGMFLLTTVANPFEMATFCRNRLDIRNGLSIAASLLRVGVVVLIFQLTAARVWHVGFGMLLAAVFSLLSAVYMWRKLLPGLRIRPRACSLTTLQDLMGTGGWVVVNQIGALLFLSIDLVIVNRLLGPDVGGKYAVVQQWAVLLTGMAFAIASVFTPTIFGYYSRQDISGLVRYTRQCVKLIGILMALPVGLVCGLARPILHVWLGQEMTALAPLMSLLTVHLCLNSTVLPLLHIQMATDKVRIPAIVTCLMGLANLGLAILLIRSTGWGMYGMAAAGAMMLTARNTAFTPLYAAHVLQRNWSIFYRDIFPAFAISLLIAGACWSAAKHLGLYSWPSIIGFSAACAIMYCVLAYSVLLTREERHMLTTKLGLNRSLGAG